MIMANMCEAHNTNKTVSHGLPPQEIARADTYIQNVSSYNDTSLNALDLTTHSPQSLVDLPIREPNQPGDANGQSTVQKKRRPNFSPATVDILKNWCKMHMGWPYPNKEEKKVLCGQTGLNVTQLNYWFINARRRILPKTYDKSQYPLSGRRKVTVPVEDGSNNSLLQNEPQAMEGNVEDVHKDQSEGQKEPMEKDSTNHTLHAIKSEHLSEQVREDQPADQKEPMEEEGANNGNNNHENEVNEDALRWHLFQGYIRHRQISDQYARNLFELGLGSEEANLLRYVFNCGYQNGLRANNANNNNNDSFH